MGGIQDAPNLNYLFAGLVVEELIRSGVEWFVVCPGSRSAPLAWSIASNPRAKTVVHHDERGAAFHALGLAKGSGKPAVFVCTSGSAVANALPAVVEASYGGVPLILLTADRPPRLQGTGANQTINQIGIYREFVRWERNFIVDDEHFDVDEVIPAIDSAYSHATGSWPGPVQLNCMMDEPLAPVTANGTAPNWSRQLSPLSSWLRDSAPVQFIKMTRVSMDFDADERALKAISTASRGVIVVGQLSNAAEVPHVVALAERLNWPIVPDITSGIARADYPGVRMYANHYTDRMFDGVDVVVHLGGPFTSRRMLDVLDQCARGKVAHLIRVSPAPARVDAAHKVVTRLQRDIAEFVAAILPRLPASATAGDLTRCGDCESAVTDVMIGAFDANDPISEPAVSFLRIWSSEDVLYLGSSMPIRDSDLYRDVSINGPRVEANRGASGIDGNIATAAGIARATGKPVMAVIGDLAALHDLNSLALLRDLKTPFALVVLNNDGGGIFSLLPIAKHTEHFERFFGTPHGLDFEHAAAMYGLAYHRPATNREFSVARAVAFGAQVPHLIEVRTNREENVRIHRELDAKIRAALDAVRG